MAMNGFVLQVELPGDDPRAQSRERPPGEIIVEKRGGEPQPIYGESERDRRPFDAAFERRIGLRSPRMSSPLQRDTAYEAMERKRCVHFKVY